MRLEVLMLAVLLAAASANKPIFAYHGYGGTVHDFDDMAQWIADELPGTPFHPLNLFNGDASYESMWKQVEVVAATIEKIAAENNYTEYHLIGHSQGALATRAVLQWAGDRLNVDNYLSLAGPQSGQYGVFTNWPFPNFENKEAYLVLYTTFVQEEMGFSGAQYWKDPRHMDEFARKVVFLPVLNNETVVPSSNLSHWRENFLQTNAVHLFGSPDDGTIQPWQSTQFGFWTPGPEYPPQHIIPMEQQSVYTALGLDTLKDQGRLFQVTPPGVEHMHWIQDKQVFDQYLLPLLT